MTVAANVLRGSQLLLLICLVPEGCAAPPTTYEVTVSSLRSTAVAEGTSTDVQTKYLLVPGNEGLRPDDLQFLEYAGHVERVLAPKGYARTDNALDAEVVVALLYDVSSSQHEYAYTTPVYGQTGGGTATFNANTYGRFGNSYTSGTVYQQPTYGVVGSQLHSGTLTVFHRRVWLSAYDVRERDGHRTLVPRWQTKIASSGDGGDLRELFPVLLAAASDSIATDTKRDRRVSINANDPRIAWVKGRAPQPRRATGR